MAGTPEFTSSWLPIAEAPGWQRYPVSAWGSGHHGVKHPCLAADLKRKLTNSTVTFVHSGTTSLPAMFSMSEMVTTPTMAMMMNCSHLILIQTLTFAPTCAPCGTHLCYV